MVRHARARRAAVAVSAGDALRIEITDDGVGTAGAARRSGLANLAARAEQLGGTFEVGAADGGGTRLVWEVPLPVEDRPSGR